VIRNRTLLIVDDEPETLKGYEAFLLPPGAAPARKSSRRGGSAEAGPAAAAPPPEPEFRLLVASSGEQALELARREQREGRRIAAGFFDVKLGAGMDGLSTLQAVRALDKDIHCVVVTAYHDRTVEEMGALFGEDFKDQWDYLNKPFTQGEIVQKARQMLAAWNRKVEAEALHAQLVRSERLAGVGQVARGVGHEFGNILLRIIGKTDLALMESDVKKIHAHLQVVMTAAERAGVIVRNLQSFSKTEPTFQLAPLSQPVEDALNLVNHELVKCSVKLEKDFAARTPIRIDVGGLGQVFLNLFINATHAMPKGGTLRIALRDEAGGVSALVQDTGTGIPADVLPRIFEFAYTTKGDRGSGLGLSISREIVEAHGGRITVSTELGKGTEFKVWIPGGRA
jgi:signal transduction histidine kinase